MTKLLSKQTKLKLTGLVVKEHIVKEFYKSSGKTRYFKDINVYDGKEEVCYNSIQITEDEANKILEDFKKESK